ncbi:MAG TPA: c-type cytochrome [Devosia sp.]|jgi:cytochrome c1|nr:c-type cytochrome [Devosia sp.]
MTACWHGAIIARGVLLAAMVLAVAACQQEGVPAEHRIVDGDPERGRAAIVAIGCGACHHVPGVRGAHGVVGPSLDAFGHRKLIGGVMPNEPTILVQWVQDAPSLIPETGMPDLPLSQAQARDIAAYLYTLR